MKNKHHWYYLSFCFILILGIVFALHASYNKQLQMIVVVMLCFSYAILGIVHHRENHSTTTKIVIEYMLIAGLAMTVFAFFLRGAL